MAGISDQALNFSAPNKYRFNGGNEQQNKEFADGSGLELCDANFRLYDPQIGRFHKPDPLAIIFEDQSPYSFALNNPVLLNNPLGLAGDTAWKPLPDVVIQAPPQPKPQTDCIPCSAASDNGSGLNNSFVYTPPPPSKSSAKPVSTSTSSAANGAQGTVSNENYGPNGFWDWWSNLEVAAGMTTTWITGRNDRSTLIFNNDKVA